MSKYQITTSFSLVTDMEPEGFDAYDFVGDADEINDGSYFSSQTVECDGGEVTYVVEADDEDEAHDKADGNISDGNDFTDHNGFTWTITNVNHDVEIVEEPMTLDRAREILSSLADQHDDDEVARAVSFLFDHLASLARQVAGLHTRVAELNAAAAQNDAAASIVATLPDSAA